MANREISRQVLVCQHRSCRKLGAALVLEAFQASEIDGVEVLGVSCLGQCGNGPMVLVLPEEVWYCRVRPQEVAEAIAQHLRGKRPGNRSLSCKGK